MPFVFECVQQVARPDCKLAVLGGGSWATAIVKILSSNLRRVYWWVREPEIVEGVRSSGHNPLYLSEAKLNSKKISVSNNLKQIIKKADVIIVVIPSAFVYGSLNKLPKTIFSGKIVISATKGMIPESNESITGFMHNFFGIPSKQLGIIVGPSHAEEIARERLTYLTSASENQELSEKIANLFRCRYVVVNLSDDMNGIETCVTLKNIYALSAGIFRGLGAGDNLLAVFNANCIKEILTIIECMYPKEKRSINSSPYLGDFLVTTYSQYSRNRNFGFMIGKGYSTRVVQIEMKMIAEGYSAVSCIYKLNKEKLNLNIPILTATYNILYEKAAVKTTIHRLLEQLK